ncbi:hypothetical protein EZV62_015484 [Acer yangbiense]|uniref:SWIM-type domain-containing protein n=1 Tax=Acer yangbiense TaxID=1000413 RepID=A0A5C7HLJ5_9ROSI|nr:hypothetical protein EZV62_015484 [Acer yangbiense]
MLRQYKGQLFGLYLWNVANKSIKTGFMEEITKLQEVNIDAYNYIMKVPLKHWALHAFEDYVKLDHVTNNISECFNVWVEKFRTQPALSILEGVRRKMMQRMTKRLDEGRNWVSNIPPLVNKKLSERQDDLRFVLVLCASDKEFEVKDGVTFYIVNLDSKRCDCGLWELSSIPCKHALAVLTANPILPPEKKRKPSRPKKNRKRAPDEPYKIKRSGGVKCSSCRAWGHNKRTCTGSITGQAGANNKRKKKMYKRGDKQSVIPTQTTSNARQTTINASQTTVNGMHAIHSQSTTMNASLYSSNTASPMGLPPPPPVAMDLYS